MAAREGFTNVEKKRVESQETLEGLRMTSMSWWIIMSVHAYF